jgi:hypothetical protein
MKPTAVVEGFVVPWEVLRKVAFATISTKDYAFFMKDHRDTCAARLDGHWEVVTITDVLAFVERPLLRCIECAGPVCPHKESNNGMRAHFEHLTRHEGCSLGSHFNGKQSPHPEAYTDRLPLGHD